MRLNTFKIILLSRRILRGGQSSVWGHGHIHTLTNEEIESSRISRLNRDREWYIQTKTEGKMDKKNLDEMRDKFPEFLPNPDAKYRDKVLEILERQDMYRRRTNIVIPEFYVGSIVAVTVADKFTPGKKSRFLGICIQRSGHGLKHCFTLRNVIEKQGVEVTYDMYCPLLQKIEVIKREKRLDRELLYLRDCPLEYSTFPQDMEADVIVEGVPVRVNPIKVPLNPRPWSERWERADLQGIQEIVYKNEKVREKLMKKKAHPQVQKAWEKEDIMKHYRESINPVEANEILTEVKKRKEKTWK